MGGRDQDVSSASCHCTKGLIYFDRPFIVFFFTKPHRTRYITSAIGPVFVVHHLVKAGLVTKNGKIIFVSSESGSINLRHEKEGGGNYAHHASKSALNMVGKLLSLDLKDQGIAVGIVHVCALICTLS